MLQVQRRAHHGLTRQFGEAGFGTVQEAVGQFQAGVHGQVDECSTRSRCAASRLLTTGINS
jgi:hypothetical protein